VVGTGFSTWKERVFDVPPPGSGFEAVTFNQPPPKAPTSVGSNVTSRVDDVLPVMVTPVDEPLQSRVVSALNPVPVRTTENVVFATMLFEAE
jgi:hypothetical protein